MSIITLVPESTVANGDNNFSPVGETSLHAALAVLDASAYIRSEPINGFISTSTTVRAENLPSLPSGTRIKRVRLIITAQAEAPSGVSPDEEVSYRIRLHSPQTGESAFTEIYWVSQDSVQTIIGSWHSVDQAGNEWTTAIVNDLQVGLACAVNSSEYSLDLRGLVMSSKVEVEHADPPDAPTIEHPDENVVLDLNQSQRFDWTFSSPETDETQSAFQRRYRAVTTTDWTTLSIMNTSTQHVDDPPNFWSAGDYEWQVRTADSQGLWGPWSASAFFTADNPPSGPEITYPSNGATISDEEDYLSWSTPDQDAYEVRKVADDGAGSPDTSIVHFDSGIVESGTARSLLLDFPVNERDEHLQVRVRHQGLWSPWSSVRVSISYTPPAEPQLTVTSEPDNGRVKVEIVNPAPATGEPSVVSNVVQRRKFSATEWIDLAVVSANGQYLDHTVASRVSYEYRVVAKGDNGTSTVSTIDGGEVELRFTWIHRVGDDSSVRQFMFNNTGGREQRGRDVTVSKFAGRDAPVAEFGENKNLTVSLDIDLDGPEDIAYMRELSDSDELWCLRDSSGRKLFGIAQNFSMTSRFYGGRASFTFVNLHHDENAAV